MGILNFCLDGESLMYAVCRTDLGFCRNVVDLSKCGGHYRNHTLTKSSAPQANCYKKTGQKGVFMYFLENLSKSLRFLLRAALQN